MSTTTQSRQSNGQSKGRTIAYWVTTGLVAAMFVLGGVMDFGRSPQVVEGMAHLGYPGYFAALLGVWKVLGAIALLAPGFPRLKEWAYAGIVFDLTGAAVSHAASGDDVGKIVTPGSLVETSTARSHGEPPVRAYSTVVS